MLDAARIGVMLFVRETHRRRRAVAWLDGSVSHEARQLDFAGLPLVPHGDGGSLDLVVLQVADGDADPALRAKPPFAAFGVSDVENPKVTRVIRIGVHQVDVTSNAGQPGKQGIAVAVAPASARRLASARKGTCQHRSERECHGAARDGSYRISQEFASQSVLAQFTQWMDRVASHAAIVANPRVVLYH